VVRDRDSLASSHSHYPYFFSKTEEIGIYDRLVGTPANDLMLAGDFSQGDAVGFDVVNTEKRWAA
jgi:hypothetical protein